MLKKATGFLPKYFEITAFRCAAVAMRSEGEICKTRDPPQLAVAHTGFTSLWILPITLKNLSEILSTASLPSLF